MADEEQPDTEAIENKALESDLAALLNSHSAETRSGTPDCILASFMLDCLAAWNVAQSQRETWHGRGLNPKADFVNQIWPES